MKLYLDTGSIEEISEIAELRLIDGVTTNPTLILKEGKDLKKEIKSIVSILNKYMSDFTLSVEVTDLSSAEVIVEEGRKLASMDKHIVVKVPLTPEGLKAVSILSEDDIRCNVTLCFSANQALLAAKAGAYIISPFIGRIDDEGWRGIELISDIKQIYKNYGFETKILAASIRSPEHVYECAKIGADIATIPATVFKKLYHHQLTDMGIAKFTKDWEEYEKKMKTESGKK